MTAEEYIDKFGTKSFHMKDMLCANHNIKAFAYRSVKMARLEEREKAIKAFRKTMDGYSPVLLKKFKELLNK
jgi:hypothetical protein